MYQIPNNMKKYKEIEFMVGSSLESVILLLWEYNKKDKLVCGNFNGHMLYSDMVDLNNINEIYFKIIGKTKDELDIELKEQNDIFEKESLEHKKSIKKKEKYYIQLGKEILDEKFHSLWEECVPIRLGGLYRGMELGGALDIIKELNNNDFNKAYDVFTEQRHSGMSRGLVLGMIKSFHINGNEFANFVNKK